MPTEVQVERRYGIRKGDLPPDRFRELCVKLTEENIAHMREEMRSLGFSIDWTTEYRTMDPSYYYKTQLSFARLYRKGLIYRGEHPVNWCPRCETAIADAEVEYEEREGELSYIRFRVRGEEDYLTVATTRPEYLHACVAVAVHPDDERYERYVGKELEVPPFGHVVKLISDREVDPKFGTGVVMICTFGDKADVRWVKRHRLPTIAAIDDRGRASEAAGKYAGLELAECRRAIVEDLSGAGLLERREKLVQSVGVCWRCQTPVEILSKPQWFMRVLDLKERAVEGAKKIRWVPEHMRARLINWIESLDWDWVISRQRIFATQIPAWYCSSCKEPIVAEEGWLPVNPLKDMPPIGHCANCGGTSFEPERDVLDTWMDSSLTIAAHAGWPELDGRLFPADLQPNGTDIIRTWDYYLLVHHLALLGEVPYRTALINGMVMGEDGRKMSKSLGNYVDTTFVRDKYGADALRQWAAIGASTGSDVPFSWKDVKFGSRFMRKLWNAARFAGLHLSGFKVQELKPEELKFRPTDRWILSRLNGLIKHVTECLDGFQFNRALGAIHNFVWHELCDMYLEEVKHRLYEGDPTADAARYALHRSISTICKLLAPFIPHFAEEVYQTYFAAEQPYPSVHVAEWPVADERFIDSAAERSGELINLVVGAIRQFKSSRGMPLSGKLSSVEIYTPSREIAERLAEGADDIRGTARAERLSIEVGKPGLEERVLAVKPDMRRLGPRLRADAGSVADALAKADPKAVAERIERGGGFELTVKDKKFWITQEDVKIIKETISGDLRVEVVNIPEPSLALIISV